MLTTTDLLAVIVKYDEIVRSYGTMEPVANDDTGEVHWETQDIASVDFGLIIDDYGNQDWAIPALIALTEALQKAYRCELDHYGVEINNG